MAKCVETDLTHKSNRIQTVKWCPPFSTSSKGYLFVTFKKGGDRYVFGTWSNLVPKFAVEAIVAAASPGGMFHKLIEGSFYYERYR